VSKDKYVRRHTCQRIWVSLVSFCQRIHVSKFQNYIKTMSTESNPKKIVHVFVKMWICLWHLCLWQFWPAPLPNECMCILVHTFLISHEWPYSSSDRSLQFLILISEVPYQTSTGRYNPAHMTVTSQRTIISWVTLSMYGMNRTI